MCVEPLVPSRMNIGQIYEQLLGWAGSAGTKICYTYFLTTLDQINELTDEAGIPRFGHLIYMIIGTERFNQAATVGVIYMLKLVTWLMIRCTHIQSGRTL
jgi:DNA-directed RNA polymerase subunit beta